PVMPAGQMQTYAPGSVARHVPPFRHGLLGRHGLPGNVVVVVVPAVHTDEPGGALVLGGHEVHAAAPPMEYVSAGHAGRAAAQAGPPQVHRPVGIAWRVWRCVSLRSSSWFSCAVSRLWKPDGFCLLLSSQTLELL